MLSFEPRALSGFVN